MTIQQGDCVKLNQAYLATLADDDRRPEAEAVYTVKAVQEYSDGTTAVDISDGAEAYGVNASWLEPAGDHDLYIDRSYRNEGPLPVFLKYDGQIGAQPAYLELTDVGNVRVDSNGEIGNAVPVTVWNRQHLRWRIPEQITVAGIDSLVAAVLPQLKELHQHHDVVWDGANHVGQLDEQGRELEESISYIIEREAWEIADVMPAGEFFYEELSALADKYRDADDQDAFIDDLRRETWEGSGVHLIGMDALRREIESIFETEEREND